MADPVPVLVVISARDCGACRNYRSKFWSEHKKIITESKKLSLAEIDLASMADETPKHYPTGVSELRKWYPMMALVNGKSWKEGKDLTIISVLNGTFANGNIVQSPANDKNRRTMDKMIEWLRASLEEYQTGSIPAMKDAQDKPANLPLYTAPREHAQFYVCGEFISNVKV